MTATREEAIELGQGGRLKGILTLPVSGEIARAMVLVNAGFVPKYGPYRIYVQIARRVAARGCAVLRLDLGGLGDSVPSSAGVLRQRTLTDLAAATDAIASRFPRAELAFGGICSGAEDSFRHAEVDPRVSRLLLVDPFAYRTPGWGWRHLRHRLWRRTLRALGVWDPPARTGDSIIDYQYMDRDESSRILARLMARGAKVHFIYTAGRREVFNHPAQLRKMFPRLDISTGTTVDHLPEIEHTQFLQRERDALIEAFERRLAVP
jgi:dienelactone hydrolase